MRRRVSKRFIGYRVRVCTTEFGPRYIGFRDTHNYTQPYPSQPRALAKLFDSYFDAYMAKNAWASADNHRQIMRVYLVRYRVSR